MTGKQVLADYNGETLVGTVIEIGPRAEYVKIKWNDLSDDSNVPPVVVKRVREVVFEE